ncbi:MAG: hypothetical protein HC902_09995 [Calothrix sp. SM1_5_4]|nr:hypothetical protein [Calothrix sp. SM1_5_4]
MANNSNNPALSAFWNCGRRGMSTTTTHYSCMAGVGDSRVIFPRDDRTYGFGTAIAVVGDKSARDATNVLKCVPASFASTTTTPPGQGPCRDANGDSFADILVMASSAHAPSVDGRTNTGAVWQFFGNYDKVFEAGNTDNFYPVGPSYYNTDATCTNFALSAHSPSNSAFSAADRRACAPTKIIPNSVPSSARMGLYSASVATGDITRDGLFDLIVGAPQDNTQGSRAGAVYAFTSLRGAGITGNIKKMIRNSTDQDDQFGYAVAVGDFDAFNQNQEATAYTCSSDGSDACDAVNMNLSLLPFNDLAVGAPYGNGYSSAGGGVHLFNSGASVLPAIRTTSDVDIYDSIASMQDFRYGETRHRSAISMAMAYR